MYYTYNHSYVYEYEKFNLALITHELTEKNRQDPVRICEEYLTKFKFRLSDSITGDECWFYHNQIGKKKVNKSWVAEGEKARAVVKIDRFEPKTNSLPQDMKCNAYTIFKTEWDYHLPNIPQDSIRPFVHTLNEQVCYKKSQISP